MSLLGIGTTIAGGAYNEYGNQRQNRQDRTNAMMQYQNQRKLNQQGNRLQMDMWNKTNYGAQVDHMKEAGLNPALMYGSAGQGGTTGSQGGGSATKAQAPKAPVMDMSNMLMGKQAELLTAQKQKTEAETKAIGGYQKDESGARQNKIAQDVINLKANKLDIEASTKLKLTQNETEEIRRDIQKLDKGFFKKNNLSPSEFGIIKGMKSALGSVKDAYDFIVNATKEEKQAAFGMDNMDERFEELQRKLKEFKDRNEWLYKK